MPGRERDAKAVRGLAGSCAPATPWPWRRASAAAEQMPNARSCSKKICTSGTWYESLGTVPTKIHGRSAAGKEARASVHGSRSNDRRARAQERASFESWPVGIAASLRRPSKNSLPGAACVMRPTQSVRPAHACSVPICLPSEDNRSVRSAAPSRCSAAGALLHACR